MISPNEPAHPVVPGAVFTGLTKREAFAMAAMQGLLSSQTVGSIDDHAASAVACADALLAKLAKESRCP